MDHSDKEPGLPATYPNGNKYADDAYPAATSAFPDGHKDTMSDTDTLASDAHLKPVGVLKVEAAEAFWNPKTKWILFIS